MKTKIFALVLAATALFFVGCTDDEPDVIVADFTPAAPQGVYSVTGDGEVYVFWNGPYESDITEYIIWRSFEPTTNYAEIGRVDAVANPDLDLYIYEYIDDAVVNGVTYYYAVSSVDQAGNVSELSAENVFDTPRPEGQAEVFDSTVIPEASGYSFAAQTTVSWDNTAADIVIDRIYLDVDETQSVFYINAANINTDLQDMGYTSSFDDIGWAPTEGWSEIGWVEVVLYHTYVIWTADNNFAKMRVTAIHTNSITFEWAYQTDEGNPELKPVVLEKPVHGEDYLKVSF
ncbi:MAG: hypothetical protein AB1483_10950 [Candidatus Zixiibacteriota bacterium]